MIHYIAQHWEVPPPAPPPEPTPVIRKSVRRRKPTAAPLALGFVYDKAKYHSGGNWPQGLPEDQALVHTGLFLAWLVERGLLSSKFERDHAEQVAALRRREMTGPKLYDRCDGVLTDEMLSPDGNAFAAKYFDFKTGEYLGDYETALCEPYDSIYEVPDTWESYAKIRDVLDRRFADWLARPR